MNYKFKNHIKNNPYLTTLVSKTNKVIYMKVGRTAGTDIHNELRRIGVDEVSLPYFRGNGSNDWVENITTINFFTNFIYLHIMHV